MFTINLSMYYSTRVKSMRSKSTVIGQLYANKRKLVFVASQNGKTCPTISLMNGGQEAKFKDDFSKGFRTSKSFTKLIFR